MRLFYNGVDIAFGQLIEYKEESVYDESGIDYLYTRATVAYVGIVGGLARLKAAGPDGRFADLTPTTHPPQPVPAAGPRTGDPYTLYVGGVPSTRSPGRPQPLVPGSGGDGLDARPIDYQTGPYPHPPAVPAVAAAVTDPAVAATSGRTPGRQGLLPGGNAVASVGYAVVRDRVDYAADITATAPAATGPPNTGEPSGMGGHDVGTPVVIATETSPPVAETGRGIGGVLADSVAAGSVLPAANRPFYNIANQHGVSYPGNRKRYQIVKQPESRAVATLQAVRHRLETPRGQLVLFAGDGAEHDDVLLSSPEAGCLCDPTGGPHPRVLSIEQVSGDANLFVVQLVIETTINEAPVNGVTNPGILLSNRYTMTHTVDQDGWTALLVRGEARFRLDYLTKYKANPDATRPLLFLPIPPQFQRKDIRVTALPDGTGVVYEYQDVQQPEIFVAGKYIKASRLEWSHRQALVSDQNLVGGMLDAYDRYLQIRYSQKWAEEAPRAADGDGGDAASGKGAETPEPKRRRRRRRRRRGPSGS